MVSKMLIFSKTWHPGEMLNVQKQNIPVWSLLFSAAHIMQHSVLRTKQSTLLKPTESNTNPISWQLSLTQEDFTHISLWHKFLYPPLSLRISFSHPWTPSTPSPPHPIPAGYIALHLLPWSHYSLPSSFFMYTCVCNCDRDK